VCVCLFLAVVGHTPPRLEVSILDHLGFDFVDAQTQTGVVWRNKTPLNTTKNCWRFKNACGGRHPAPCFCRRTSLSTVWTQAITHHSDTAPSCACLTGVCETACIHASTNCGLFIQIPQHTLTLPPCMASIVAVLGPFAIHSFLIMQYPSDLCACRRDTDFVHGVSHLAAACMSAWD
jgi:hypothetical protein